MGSNVRLSRRTAGIALLATSLVIGACLGSERGPAGGLSFLNATDVTVMITAIDDKGLERDEPIIHELGPGLRWIANDRFLINECADVTLVARSLDGVEVDRYTGMICAPGEWVVDDQPAESP